ncbi:MAG: shikimate dehydrogenase [Melioribacteraceae bacterium]|nr:shikimate dehydrogenase [Melioribacteraceae bacterium]
MLEFEKKFNKETGIIGVIGHPIKHSLSPAMQNKAFSLGDQNFIYLPFDVPQTNLKDALKGMIALGIKGFNITIPHKEYITQFLNDVSEEASVIGAVNTIVNENGILHGYNTDVNGIIETLAPFKDDINDQVVSVIGSGGAARSVIYALIRHFKVKRINIINRTEQTAESMKEYFGAKMVFPDIKTYALVPPDLVEVFGKSKLIVNTTSIGMNPEVDDSPTTIEKSFNKDQIVFDVIYTPLKTKFLELAESQGATIVNGLKMFVVQGARSYELWTGEDMPIDEIYEMLETELGKVE